MQYFKEAVITKIFEPITVSSERGRYFKMNNRNCYGISFCLKGQITYQMNGKQFVSKKGYAVILPKNATYTLHGDSDGLFPVMDFDAVGLNIDEFLVIPLKNEKDLIDIYEQMKIDFRCGNNLLVYEKFYNLLGRIIAEQESDNSPLPQVINFINENIADCTLSNNDIAKFFGLSEGYFRKLFLKNYGITPKQYILNMRIQKSKQLLTDTPYTITSISEMCGFSSCYHFCRAFKCKVGKTPSEYASQNKRYKI